MIKDKKGKRYERIYSQLQSLVVKSNDMEARMATVIAVLHHKIDNFFWTGFYFLKDEDLIVKMYQGPVACQILKKDTGVCWKCVNDKKTIIVPDVDKFPGHIACDSRTKSEIVIPFFDDSNKIIGVLDVDSSTINSFDNIDAVWLEKILKLIFK